MKIIFTICSNNYLAQAKALGDSITQTNPDYTFFIGLVDEFSSKINYEKEIGFPIIQATEIGISDFDSLWKKYDIVELNTCVKPFYLEYFSKKYDDLDYLMYFDPDTFVFGDIKDIELELENGNEILLTPHVLTPIPLDGKSPTENSFLNFGIYNLGFLALKNPIKNLNLFKWWGERTYNVGFSNVANGYFVDQLWINLVPIYYDNVAVSKNYGLNMAPWNLHERILSKNTENLWMVNFNKPLVFYHFSNFYYYKPEILATHYVRYNFENRPDLRDFYNDYLQRVLKNNVKTLCVIPCVYVEKRKKYSEEEAAKKLEIVNKRKLIYRVKEKIKKILK